jgi:hypothetical protein
VRARHHAGAHYFAQLILDGSLSIRIANHGGASLICFFYHYATPTPLMEGKGLFPHIPPYSQFPIPTDKRKDGEKSPVSITLYSSLTI